jgi:hypothetical protein
MNVDAIRALSYSEAPTLGVAIATMAKHRMELDAALRAAELQQVPVTTDGAAEQRALDKMTSASEPPHTLDKTA